MFGHFTTLCMKGLNSFYYHLLKITHFHMHLQSKSDIKQSDQFFIKDQIKNQIKKQVLTFGEQAQY